MKRSLFTLKATLAIGLALMLGSCGTSVYVARTDVYSDDLYETHDRDKLARAEARQRAAQEAAEAERQRKLNALVATAEANSEIDSILDDQTVDTNPYTAILADDYESAYQRRLRGFSSPTYRMPSSYYNFRYSDAYFLTMAYDPAFYNVVVMGDEVWVEPRYVSSMFGSWGRPYWYNGWNYGYNYWDPYWPSYSWGYDPFYWGYGYGYPYYGCNGWYGPHHPHYGQPYPPIHGGGHHDKNVVHRPSFGTGTGTSSGRSSRTSYANRLNDDRTRVTRASSSTSTGIGNSTSRSSSPSSGRSSRSSSSYDSGRSSSSSSSTRSSSSTTYESSSSSRGGGRSSSTSSGYSSSSSSHSSSSSSSSSHSSGSRGGGRSR